MTDSVEGVDVPPNTAVKPRRRFLGTSAKPSSSKTPIRRVANQIPEDILHDAALNEAIRGEWVVSVKMALAGAYSGDDGVMMSWIGVRVDEQDSREITTSRSTRRSTKSAERESRSSRCRCQRG